RIRAAPVRDAPRMGGRRYGAHPSVHSAAGLERRPDLGRAETVPAAPVAAVFLLQLEGAAEERIGAEQAQALAPAADEALRVFVERALGEANRDVLIGDVVRGQGTHRLARPAGDRSPQPVVLAHDLRGGDLVARFLDLHPV